MTRHILKIATLAALALGQSAAAESHMQAFASADVSGNEEGVGGTVTLYRTASDTVLARFDLSGLPGGMHGVHLHETGDCSADDFSSAGGHIAGDQSHGVLADGGPHPGDMPNVNVGSDGTIKNDAFLPLLDLEAMIGDEDGAAVIVHSGADDYTSQPSGDAGSRIACGVFEMD